ncbi:hypothetical protein EYF80_053690 [Liparis tanakae]|uniref:Uncharacterized protein n=1 Tax=Liparis tanakae TaxID=230148 RepID=A0A4Z2F4W3_9TELE|nr:hypothetical protein EYF80_053690 [Liparis tanakae]
MLLLLVPACVLAYGDGAARSIRLFLTSSHRDGESQGETERDGERRRETERDFLMHELTLKDLHPI